MTGDLIYRTASVADLDQLQKLGITAYSQFEGDLTPDNWKIFNDFLQDKQSFASILSVAACFVCENNDQLAGAAYIIPSGNPTDLFKPEWSYIRMVGVDPAYQGRGIAKKLTYMCIEFAKQNKERTIALHTSEFMHVARHIYEKAGFKILQKIRPRFGKKYWLYTLDLSKDTHH